MKITKIARAGTLESNDISVVVAPQDSDDNTIELSSTVMYQYGDAIKETIENVLKKHNITGVLLTVNDRGALDCTIEARVETALEKAGLEVKY